VTAVSPGGPVPADAEKNVRVQHRRLRDAAARRGVPLATILVAVAVVVITYLAGKRDDHVGASRRRGDRAPGR